jgi:hypothetical protein
MDIEQLVATVLTIVGSGGVAAVIVKWLDRTKTSASAGKIDAEAADVIQKASSEVVAMMGEQLRQALTRITALETSIATKDLKIKEMDIEIAHLRSQIRKMENGK